MTIAVTALFTFPPVPLSRYWLVRSLKEESHHNTDSGPLAHLIYHSSKIILSITGPSHIYLTGHILVLLIPAEKL